MFIVLGLQVPIIKLLEITASVGGIAPEQKGEIVVNAGVIDSFITTLIFFVSVQLVLSVTNTEYVPFIKTEALGIIGFWSVLVKPLGPVQSQDTPVLTNKFMLVPEQIGLLLEAIAFNKQLLQFADAPSISI